MDDWCELVGPGSLGLTLPGSIARKEHFVACSYTQQTWCCKMQKAQLGSWIDVPGSCKYRASRRTPWLWATGPLSLQEQNKNGKERHHQCKRNRTLGLSLSFGGHLPGTWAPRTTNLRAAPEHVLSGG